MIPERVVSDWPVTTAYFDDISAGWEQWALLRGRERLSNGGKVKKDLVWFVRIPGYKDEYADGSGDYHVETGRDPRPVGAAWVRFFYVAKPSLVQFEVTQAVI